jgi:hypothetical protein
VRFSQADLNTVSLPKREFDLVFCHACLHHVLELENWPDRSGTPCAREASWWSWM